MVNKFNDDGELLIDDKQLKDPKQIFPERLKTIRTKHNKSIPEFAAFLGISRQMLADYENGVRYPRFDTLVLISKKVNVSISYLIGESKTQVNEIAKLSIAEYTGLSEEAIDNLHFTKFLNETYYGESMSSTTDAEENYEEKRPYYYYISALLSQSGPQSFEIFENDLEYYCKASRQLREAELLLDQFIKTKEENEANYKQYDNKTNGLFHEYFSVFRTIIEKEQNPDVDYFCLSEDYSVNYGALSDKELLERKNKLEGQIIKKLHMPKPKVEQFVRDYIKVQDESMEYYARVESLKDRKARAFITA